MKGGSFRRWWGNQEYIVNWANDGVEIRAFTPRAVIRNPNYYFRSGVTWTDLTSGRFSARLSPGGFIFDVAGSSVFPPDVSLVLAVMNSTLAQYILKLINPTVHVQVGDLKRLPISTTVSQTLHALVEQVITLSQVDSAENETTYEFVAPPGWPGGGEDVAARAKELAEIERQIDEEVYRLYGISAEDRQAIVTELAEPTLAADDAGTVTGEDEQIAEDNGTISSDDTALDAGTIASGLTRQALAARWVSYAIGIVLGRFQPGVEGALGCGQISPDKAAALRSLAVPNGVAVLDPGHEDDLIAMVERALSLLVGEAQVEPLLTAATGGRPLSEWLVRDYFKHVQQYRKRPIYWLLQSPKRRYSLWLFHEFITRDTLHLLQGNRYLGGRINRARSEVQARRERLVPMPQGAERRKLEREIDALEGELTDLEAFAKALAAVTSQTNTRGEIVDWAPEVDDGVLINLAPLWTLLPSWATEPKQCWQALERGDYDWSHTAMRYWPDRVLVKCQTNTSYALAHGVAAQAVTSRKP
jgi:hypothetical protein